MKKHEKVSILVRNLPFFEETKRGNNNSYKVIVSFANKIIQCCMKYAKLNNMYVVILT